MTGREANHCSAAVTVVNVKDVIDLIVHVSVKIDGHCGRNRPADRPCTPDANDTEHIREEKSKHNAEDEVCKGSSHKRFHGASAA